MNKTTTIECLECNHVHEIAIVRGETAFEDYAECPERCEACGASFDDTGVVDDRRSERRQMGVTF